MKTIAIQIAFDGNYHPIEPTLLLGTKSGLLLGKLPATSITFRDNLNSASELSCSVYKADCTEELWDKIQTFRLLYAKEWNAWFEIEVDTEETSEIVKHITATSLGEAELSQIYIYDVEINTEDDIANEDYTVTQLYHATNPKASLLHRILEKAPHYRIGHVDASIANIQRSFSFRGTTIYDAFMDIAEEIHCLFDIRCFCNASGQLEREVSVYDLDSYCVELTCNYRGDYEGICPECGSNRIYHGYGEDTSILVSVENLADNITYKIDAGSVKNCLRLEAGDDLMTATVRSLNPSGSNYLWHLPNSLKEDMSDALVAKLEAYDALQKSYLSNYNFSVTPSSITAFNQLVEKYTAFTTAYSKLPENITNYEQLMIGYYQVIDFYYFLNNALMPSISLEKPSIESQATQLTEDNLSPVAVSNLSVASKATVESAVLAMAKTLVDSRYQVKLGSSEYQDFIWSGNFTLTSFSDDTLSATSPSVRITITENYEQYLRQMIEKSLNSNTVSSQTPTNLAALITLEAEGTFATPESKNKATLSLFAEKLTAYGLVSLQSFYNSCQACVQILTQQGVADDSTSTSYKTIYLPYLEKLDAIAKEIAVREGELAIISGANGIQKQIEQERERLNTALDFQQFLGDTLWNELCSYRREDVYRNENYISDGLSNAQLFATAQEFLKTAQKEIARSSTPQHTISASLHNLLVMREFAPIVAHFSTGNWIRIKTDGRLFRLRLLSYEIDFDNLSTLQVEFSDVKTGGSSVSDIQSVLSQATSMASTYSYVARQTDQTVRDLLATKATLSTNQTVVNSIAQKADMLEANTMTVNGILSAAQARILELDVSKLSTENADLKFAEIEQLKADKAVMEDLYVQVERVEDLMATHADIENLNTQYANIDFANIGKAAFEHFYSNSGLIKDVVVGDQTVTGELVGVTIRGDRIVGGTVQADKLVIRGTDGLYYALNTNGETVESEQTTENALDGKYIIANTITATKINVEDLVAFDATIGGLKIADGSIYSAVKDSINNQTAGIYMDKAGQFYVGDGFNFLRFFQDATTKEWKLHLNADTIKLGGNQLDLGTELQEIRDEVTTNLRIESSRGTVFKNNMVSTVLSAVIYRGSKRITDLATLRQEMGANAHLQWKWQRMGEEEYGLISASDKRLFNDGFSFALSPEDVDTKITFLCELIS